MIKGSIVALSTPFNDDGVNVKTLKELIEFHNRAGTDGILVLGTTGESPTLSQKEKEIIIEKTLEWSKIPVIVGTGTNSTEKTIQDTKRAREIGAEYVLIITPYYNKPNQEGLFRHFSLVAEKVDVKIIIYNVPGRTGVSIKPETVAELSKIENIIGIKEASGDLKAMMKIIFYADMNFVLLSGDDFITLPVISIGGKGVISVTANIIPERMKRFVDFCLKGEIDNALSMNQEIVEISDALFIDTNPIPVKAALNMIGFDMGKPRLPLTELSKENQEKLKKVLMKYNVLK